MEKNENRPEENAGNGDSGFYDFDFGGDGSAESPKPEQPVIRNSPPPMKREQSAPPEAPVKRDTTPAPPGPQKPPVKSEPPAKQEPPKRDIVKRNITLPPAKIDPKDPPVPRDYFTPPKPEVKRAAQPSPRKENAPKSEPVEPEEDFEIDFDFDREYRDVPDDDPLRSRQERRSGCFGGLMYAVFIICAAIILACLGWLAATDVLGLTDPDTLVQVTIPKDSSIDDITDILYDNGLIKYKFLFKLYAMFAGIEGDENKATAGTYVLNTNYDYYALVNGMSPRTGKRVEVTVTLAEGLSLAQMFAKLEETGVCSAPDLWEAASGIEYDYDFLEDCPPLGDKYRLEGFLFPDTYNFYLNDSPSRVIRKLLDRFEQIFNEQRRQKVTDSGYTLREIIIIASMIEKEAAVAEDRPLISSVIYNRLSSTSYPRLEIDATIWYAIAETEETFSINLENPYNTYRNEGLPPGPISNPGRDSIDAALSPATSNYYFYALGQNRAHRFFRTYEEHIAFVNSSEYGG